MSFVAFYAVLINVPYWIIAHRFGFIAVGWFSVEYAAVGLLAIVAHRSIAAALLAAAMVADVLWGTFLTFNLPIRTCLENLRVSLAFAGDSRNYFILISLALTIVGAWTLGSASNLPTRHHRLAATSLTVFAVSVLASNAISIRLEKGYWPSLLTASHTTDSFNPGRIHFPLLARIPVIRLMRLETLSKNADSFEKVGPASNFPMQSATDVALHGTVFLSEKTGPKTPNIVQVVLESWGLSNDTALNEALVAAYLQPDLQARYKVLQGAVPFWGPTVPGEARELCDSQFGFHITAASGADLQTCLPDRLAGLGYRTIGVHGMSGYMFMRSAWYKVIGFQEIWFREQLESNGLHDCSGAIIGTCDTEVAAWIGRRLRTSNAQPMFFHWMTLRSHLPVAVPAGVHHAAPCTPDLGVQRSTPLCSWYQLIANANQSIARIALGPLARPTIFVIVGDHAPPFSDQMLRNDFSRDVVPYVVLIPLSQGHQSVAKTTYSPPRVQWHGHSQPHSHGHSQPHSADLRFKG